MIDVLIVGSGASAVNAAWPIVESGCRVVMLDVGNKDEHYEPLLPRGSFSQARRSDPQQHRYFLGDDFEGISFDELGSGPQLTPPRQFVVRDAEKLLPFRSNTFFPILSMARGGAASAWGAGSPPFLESDLQGMPLHDSDLEPFYERVAERIGISGSASDDVSRFLGPLRSLQPPLRPDRSATGLLAAYEKRRSRLNGAGFYLGHPRLAVLSRPLGARSETRYHDMEFWSDREKNVYRPRWTLDDLCRFPNFEYQPGVLVTRFEEAGPHVTVSYRAAGASIESSLPARLLVLGAGTFSSTQLVLRSLGFYDRPVPLVCNPHSYAVMLNFRHIGKPSEEDRYSLAQLCFALERETSGVPSTFMGHVYSYRSLMLEKLVREAPLSVRTGFEFFRALTPAMAIAIMQHADQPTPAKTLHLTKTAADGDVLEASYALSDEEQRRNDAAERAVIGAFRSIGALCLSRVRAPHGASVHYAGTLPMSVDEEELTTDISGKLRGTRNVYVVDGSVFPRLPSKGLTFTMMANADRIGSTIVRERLGATASRPETGS